MKKGKERGVKEGIMKEGEGGDAHEGEGGALDDLERRPGVFLRGRSPAHTTPTALVPWPPHTLLFYFSCTLFLSLFSLLLLLPSFHLAFQVFISVSLELLTSYLSGTKA